MQHQCNIRGIHKQKDKKLSGILKDIFTQAVSKAMHLPYKQHSMNNARETLVNQSPLTQVWKLKLRKAMKAHEVVDNGKTCEKNQA